MRSLAPDTQAWWDQVRPVFGSGNESWVRDVQRAWVKGKLADAALHLNMADKKRLFKLNQEVVQVMRVVSGFPLLRKGFVASEVSYHLRIQSHQVPESLMQLCFFCREAILREGEDAGGRLCLVTYGEDQVFPTPRGPGLGRRP